MKIQVSRSKPGSANLSPQRQTPLEQDVDVSDSPEQIRELLKRAMEKNLKSGWRKVSSLTEPLSKVRK